MPMPIVTNHRKALPATPNRRRYHVEVHNGSAVIARHHFTSRPDARAYADKVDAQGLYQFTLVPEDGTIIHVCNHRECEDLWI